MMRYEPMGLGWTIQHGKNEEHSTFINDYELALEWYERGYVGGYAVAWVLKVHEYERAQKKRLANEPPVD